MTERCADCVGELSNRCTAIRALFREQITVIYEPHMGPLVEDEIAELGPEDGEKVADATYNFIDDMKEAGCSLDLPAITQVSLSEAMAAITLAGVKHLESLPSEDQELDSDALLEGFLEGVDESLVELRDVIETAKLTFDEPDDVLDFFREVNSGIEYMFVKDYCEVQGWNPSALNDEQKAELERALKENGFNS